MTAPAATGTDGRRLGLRTALGLGWRLVPHGTLAPIGRHGGGWRKGLYLVLWVRRPRESYHAAWKLYLTDCRGADPIRLASFATIVDAVLAAEELMGRAEELRGRRKARVPLEAGA